MFKRWDRVELATRVYGARTGLCVSNGTVGRVVKVDNDRSRYGFNVLVVWKRMLPRATWVPEHFLRKI